ncbi:MAG: Lsr2 family protein [Ilumatobacteraceae bacterium]
MATRTIHIVTDDIDDSESDVQTVRFAYEGSSYEIDLGPANRERFEQAIALFVGHARRQGGNPIPRSPGRAPAASQANDTTYARRWHVAEGLPVSDRGRLKPEQMNAWAAAGAPRLDS